MNNYRLLSLVVLLVAAQGCASAVDKVWGTTPWLDTRWAVDLESPVQMSGYPRNTAGVVLDPALELLVAASSLRTDEGRVLGLSLVDGALRWEFNPQAATASLLLADNQLFVADFEGSIWKLDPATGKPLWEKPVVVAAPVDARPLLHRGVLYLHDSADGLWALRASDGEVLWMVSHPLPSTPGLLGQATPVVLDDALVLAAWTDGSISALTVADGQESWNRKLCDSFDGLNDADMVPIPLGGGRILAACHEGSLFELSAEDGSILGRREATRPLYSTRVDETLYLVSGASQISALDLDGLAQRWSLHLWAPLSHAPLICGSSLVLPMGDSLALADPETGALEARYQLEHGLSSAPVCKDSDLYFVSNGGKVRRASLLGL
jgi:outer membrane protein assembly factor BamB